MKLAARSIRGRAARQGIDLSVVVVVHDGEEHIGLLLGRLLRALRALRRPFELLVVDEHSSDNTLAVLALSRRRFPEMAVVPGVALGRGLLRGAERARGRSLLFVDARAGARTEGPGALFSLGLSRLEAGEDVVVAPPYLLLRRSRTLPLLSWLDGGGRPSDLLRLLPGLRRGCLWHRLRLCEVPERGPRGRGPLLWQRLRSLLLPSPGPPLRFLPQGPRPL